MGYWKFTLYRMTAGLLFSTLMAVVMIAILSNGWGLLVFASPVLMLLLYFLHRTILVRCVRIDGPQGEISVRSGVLFPFMTRQLPLAAFANIRIHERRGVFEGTRYEIRLEGARKPLDMSPGASCDPQQANRIASQLGQITRRSVF